MTKIRTAEEVLQDHHKMRVMGSKIESIMTKRFPEEYKDQVIETMIEYAKQFIDLAAEECEPITDLTTDQIAEIPVNYKESILKLKERVV